MPPPTSESPRTGQMFVAMAGAQLQLTTGATRAATPVDHPDAHFLAPEFVETWARQVLIDPYFAPVMKGGGLARQAGTP